MRASDGDSPTPAFPSEVPVAGVPRHVAIMLDGNGRWATSRGLPRSEGHLKGYDAWCNISGVALELGIEYLTLFFMSAENFKRPPAELDFILNLWRRFLSEEVPKLHTSRVRFKCIGDRTMFSHDIAHLIEDSEKLTEGNSRMTLTIAAAYGGRQDLVTAMRRSAAEGDATRLSEKSIRCHLSTYYAPDPDIVIRPGGEKRLSNFAIWQIAFSELYFTSTLWPDFGRAELRRAIEEYRERSRTFGNIT